MLDTNVILKALIKNSVVRGILLRSSHEFMTPEFAIEETRNHLDMVARKSGLTEKEVESVMDVVLANVSVIPAERVLAKWKDAQDTLAKIDEGDVPFVATAMSVECDGIWSDDKHLERQSRVKVWTTKEVATLGRA